MARVTSHHTPAERAEAEHKWMTARKQGPVVDPSGEISENTLQKERAVSTVEGVTLEGENNKMK